MKPVFFVLAALLCFALSRAQLTSEPSACRATGAGLSVATAGISSPRDSFEHHKNIIQIACALVLHLNSVAFSLNVSQVFLPRSPSLRETRLETDEPAAAILS